MARSIVRCMAKTSSCRCVALITSNVTPAALASTATALASLFTCVTASATMSVPMGKTSSFAVPIFVARTNSSVTRQLATRTRARAGQSASSWTKSATGVAIASRAKTRTRQCASMKSALTAICIVSTKWAITNRVTRRQIIERSFATESGIVNRARTRQTAAIQTAGMAGLIATSKMASDSFRILVAIDWNRVIRFSFRHSIPPVVYWRSQPVSTFKCPLNGPNFNCLASLTHANLARTGASSCACPIRQRYFFIFKFFFDNLVVQ